MHFLLEITEFQSMFIQLAFYFIAGKKMPPKKRRGIASAKPGMARRYLQENFGSFLASAGKVMNGHILQIYMNTAGFSVAKSANQLKQLLREQLHVSTERSYKADLQRLVSNTIRKYMFLRNPEEFRKFRMACKGCFDLKLSGAPVSVHRIVEDVGPISLRASEVVPHPTVDSSVSPSMQDAPTSTGSVPACSTAAICSTRSATEQITPHKMKLKKCLEFAASSSSKQRGHIKELRKTQDSKKSYQSSTAKKKSHNCEEE